MWQAKSNCFCERRAVIPKLVLMKMSTRTVWDSILLLLTWPPLSLSLSHCWSSVNDVASVQAVCTVGSTLIVSLSPVMTIAEIN